MSQNPSQGQANVAAIRGAYEAFARRDIPSVLGAFDPQIRWQVPDLYPAGGEYRGREGVGQFFQALGENWEELNVGPETYLADGDRVVVIGRHRGRLKKNGAAVEVPFVHVWRLPAGGGGATEFREYADPGDLLRALER
jgi:ketosteroid isomerase-like protein